ncbi:methyltransferase family protein [Urbifossiella limnaea]|uniref:Isoprenylcysteine carboxyl methyltransferase (ICMT) family protein n=1 Tax=Urbifossiella limnaea TaxID=2528023 RepID=A0A517XLV5_9BACT|nr:isoprenylcysteine carboxylmethyltransferase family protein [Urbifossiella limnaea]QDU18484.1 Isoprenylcysteine carboxyl methyltransferase (ICMT) family protein [Urbifossiella limnaea]
MAAVARAVAFAAVVGGVVFAAAGRLDLPFVWGLLATLVGFYVILVWTADPGLVRERVAPGGPNRDRLTRPLAAVFLGSHWLLAGLDARLGWSPVPWELRAAGLAGYAAALCVNLWAVRVNRFYSSAVRVQADRGQQVADAGPYRVVRHPGYTATILAALAGGLALGSWVALLPALGFVALFVRRAVLEDRMLVAELPGYADYARRVRRRLVPGVF